MLFNSVEFFAFFLVAGTAVVLLRRRVTARNVVLVIAGYFFYAQWDWRFLGLLLLTTLLDYVAGLLLDDGGELTPAPDDVCTPPPAESLARAAARPHRHKLVLAASISINLLMLGFFKYFNFFTESAVALFDAIGLQPNRATLDVLLPVGISFYTFASIAYVVDVYRYRVRAERSLLTYAAYVAFFPQLVAGPIERMWHLGPQLRAPTTFVLERLYSACFLIGWGLFKKVVIADNMATVVDHVLMHPAPRRTGALLAMYAFAIQIYCDFSGYTDIARGTARAMGFELLRNFDTPYLAPNPQEFWRRWHISLSTWLRDYVYIPLGGSALGRARTYANLMLTMVLGGLWHGAAWTFVLWGAFHGLLLCAHRAMTPWLKRTMKFDNPGHQAAWDVARIVGTFHLVCFGWILFRANSMDQLGRWIGGIVHIRDQITPRPAEAWGRVPSPWIWAIFVCLALIYLADLWLRERRREEAVFEITPWRRAALYAAGILAFILFGNFGGGTFIYFQF